LQRKARRLSQKPLCHFLDEFRFQVGVDLVFGAEPTTQIVEFLLLFPRGGPGNAAETMTEVVLRDGDFTLHSFGSSGMLRVQIRRH
jgi:hypothetical protein